MGTAGSGGTSGSSGSSGSSGLGGAYFYNQASSSDTWVINHNLNQRYPAVQVYNASNAVVVPLNIISNTVNQTTITFGTAITGNAVITYGSGLMGTSGTSGSSGTSAIGSAYFYNQASASATWVITHNLNQRYPAVAIYDNTNTMVIPLNVISDSVNQTTVSFGAAITGNAVITYGSSQSTSGTAGSAGTSGVYGYSVRTVTTTYSETVTTGSIVILGNTTGGAFTVNLPTAANNTSELRIKKIAGVPTLTVDANASETIDGSLTASIININDSIRLIPSGSNWYIV
jgi:hypothetical protein